MGLGEHLRVELAKRKFNMPAREPQWQVGDGVERIGDASARLRQFVSRLLIGSAALVVELIVGVDVAAATIDHHRYRLTLGEILHMLDPESRPVGRNKSLGVSISRVAGVMQQHTDRRTVSCRCFQDTDLRVGGAFHVDDIVATAVGMGIGRAVPHHKATIEGDASLDATCHRQGYGLPGSNG